MSGLPEYDVLVVGGGPAGLTAAIYTTRLGHETAVVNREHGRHSMVAHVHNVLGVSETTSGRELGEIGQAQFEEYGGKYRTETVTGIDVVETDRRFRVRMTETDALADRIVLATGFSDVAPNVESLRRFTGRGLHYCLHCDAYTLVDEPVYVLGHNEHAAHVALVMLNFTADVDLLLDGKAPEWDDETDEQLRAHPVECVAEEVTDAYSDSEADDEPRLGGFEFAGGTTREYTGGFAMYGSVYNTDLAADVGCELNDDGSVAVDEDGRTSVEGVYAAGDVTHGQNQTPVAMGDGARVGVAIDKELRRYPLSSEALATEGPPDKSDVPAMSETLRTRARDVRASETHAGMTPRHGDE